MSEGLHTPITAEEWQQAEPGDCLMDSKGRPWPIHHRDGDLLAVTSADMGFGETVRLAGDTILDEDGAIVACLNHPNARLVRNHCAAA